MKIRLHGIKVMEISLPIAKHLMYNTGNMDNVQQICMNSLDISGKIVFIGIQKELSRTRTLFYCEFKNS